MFSMTMMMLFSFNNTATTEIYTLSLHDALPISPDSLMYGLLKLQEQVAEFQKTGKRVRSEEHTSELQSRLHLVCRLLLEKKNTNKSLSSLRMSLAMDIRRGRV